MKKLSIMAVLVMVMGLLIRLSPALADGTETLGLPGISIASGSGVVVAGTGLEAAQPGEIKINVPLGATVKQVLLYWEGVSKSKNNRCTPTNDNTIEVEGMEVIGTLIGGPTVYPSGKACTTSFRADITDLDLVVPGANTLEVGGLNFTRANNGAGIFVIFNTPSFSGRATVVDVNILDVVDTTLVDTGPLPPAGGHLEDFLANVNIPGVLSSGTATASTTGEVGESHSEATLEGLSLTVAGIGHRRW